MAAICGLLFSSLANADDETRHLTGVFLLEVCKDGTTYGVAGGLCAGLIGGVIDMHNLFFHDNPIYCAPAEMTNKQAMLVVEKYLSDHPERLHEARAVLILDALKHAFPCKK